MSGMDWPTAAVWIAGIIGAVAFAPVTIMAAAWAEKRGRK